MHSGEKLLQNSEKRQVTTLHNKVDESHHHNVEEKPHKKRRPHTIWFHLYKIQKQVKVSIVVDSGHWVPLFREGGCWDERQEEDFGVQVMIYFLIWELIIWLCSLCETSLNSIWFAHFSMYFVNKKKSMQESHSSITNVSTYPKCFY